MGQCPVSVTTVVAILISPTMQRMNPGEPKLFTDSQVLWLGFRVQGCGGLGFKVWDVFSWLLLKVSVVFFSSKTNVGSKDRTRLGSKCGWAKHQNGLGFRVRPKYPCEKHLPQVSGKALLWLLQLCFSLCRYF